VPKPKKEPTREEERLMLLSGIKSVEELEEFLSKPSLGPVRCKYRPPDEAYRLSEENARKEAEQELVDELEHLYRLSPP
jgi:hypothetical protein